MSSVTYDPDRHLAEELRLNLQMMANRDFTNDPLTASELLITIPREKFYRMCQLSLDALQQRYKHPAAALFDAPDTGGAFTELPTQNRVCQQGHMEYIRDCSWCMKDNLDDLKRNYPTKTSADNT